MSRQSGGLNQSVTPNSRCVQSIPNKTESHKFTPLYFIPNTPAELIPQVLFGTASALGWALNAIGKAIYLGTQNSYPFQTF